MEDAKSCTKRLKELLTELKDNCEKVAIILQTGGRCCRQVGCICQVDCNSVTLFTDNGDCNRIYIPFDCICAVVVLCEDEDKDEDEASKKNRKDKKNCEDESVSESPSEKEINQNSEECRVDKENNEGAKERAKQITERETEEEVIKVNNKVYGYGRKIRINFLSQESEVAINEVAAVELSLNVSDENNRNLIQYFHRNQTDDRNLGVSVLPAGPGEIDLIRLNDSATEAVITGKGLIYINSQPQTEEEFKLTVTAKEVSMELVYQGEQLVFGPEEMVGVGRQRPITIEQEK